MKKLFTLLTILMLATTGVTSAQTSSSASQVVQLQLNPVIEIGTVFNLAQYILRYLHNYYGLGHKPGVTAGNTTGNSGNQEFMVRSNKQFRISVMSAQPNDNVYMALADNNTGGSAAKKYESKYAPLPTTDQDLLTNCALGESQHFAVNYKLKTKSKAPVTKSDIIYTATLP
jgi:hypothetical protein